MLVDGERGPEDGFHVVNVIATLERSHHIAADGRFRAEYFVTVGVDGYFPGRGWTAI